METTSSRVCTICAREKPISHYTKNAKVTCASCITKRRRQHKLREQKKKIQTEAQQKQNDTLQDCITEQSVEVERLQAALTAFREPDAISNQLLHQLWSQPHDTAAINQLLAVPFLPSEPRGNLACSAGILASEQDMQSVPEATQPLNNLPIDPHDDSATIWKKYEHAVFERASISNMIAQLH